MEGDSVESGPKEAMEKNAYPAAIERGIKEALIKVRERFDLNEDPIGRLPFHCSPHTQIQPNLKNIVL